MNKNNLTEKETFLINVISIVLKELSYRTKWINDELNVYLKDSQKGINNNELIDKVIEELKETNLQNHKSFLEHIKNAKSSNPNFSYDRLFTLK